MAQGKRIRIVVGDIELEGRLNGSPTAEELWDALPLEAQGSYWGDELYFAVPVEAKLEPRASDVVDPGAIAFWPPGNCLCLFWGPTPASRGDECRAASPVNVAGEVVNREDLPGMKDKRVRIERLSG